MPGAEFEFITTRTGADTILMQAHSDDLPDIIVGMPSGTRYDTDDLNQYLYDFNGTDIPGLFYKAYQDQLQVQRAAAIRWLPGCAALEGVMANLDLFEQNTGVAVPADYASSAAACEKFAQYGILRLRHQIGSTIIATRMHFRAGTLPRCRAVDGPQIAFRDGNGRRYAAKRRTGA